MAFHSAFNGEKVFRTAIFFACAALLVSCASTSDRSVEEYAAYGYLSPAPTTKPELIGIFETVKECEEAADGWASRQVVGNLVYAECYPVDRD